MSARAILVSILVAGAVGAAGLAAPHAAHSSPTDVTAHEWGTFTTVAGPDGRAIDWLPLGGPVDLPCFVEHYRNDRLSKVLPGDMRPVDYAEARATLRGKVRMETPVLYFYGPRETKVSVTVQFPRGLMTEWYPHATVTQSWVATGMLRDPKNRSAIEWKDVTIAPRDRGVVPGEEGESHYYAARATESSLLRVGGQHEKFLFYRGVGDFDVPIAAAALPGGGVRVSNLSSHELPVAVLFERRGGAVGYRVATAVRGETTIAAPELTASAAALATELERALVGAGMFQREAAAMVNTWRDTWFEQGTRVFYIVPSRLVDTLLPLRIDPAPARVARAFVGRMELVTEATQRSVAQAIARTDGAALEAYGRCLGPITDRILATTTRAADSARIREVTGRAWEGYLRRAAVCE